MSTIRPVVVVGAGVAGLTVAYRLFRADIPTVVLETAERPGGRLRMVEVAGLRLPAGADLFVARKPWAVDLCRELGLRLDSPAPAPAWLWTERGLVRMPTGAFGIPGDLGDVLRWTGISRRGRRRALRDLVLRARRTDEDETLGSLLRRRLGDEVTDRAIAPLLGGLSAGDVDHLSARGTFPELIAWERAQGSLLRGAFAATKHAREADAGPVFLRPRGGVDALTDSLAMALPDVRTDVTVRRVTPGRIELEQEPTAIDASAVVLATPPDAASTLLAEAAPAQAADLAQIRMVSTAVLLFVYAGGTDTALPEGSGFVVPRGRAPFTAVTWLSRKWPDPEFGSRAVLRCYVGADGDEEVVDAPDGDLVEACGSHLAALLDLPGLPEHAAVIRWPRSMPQYEIGHLERVARVRDGLPPGMFVAGNAYDGVGVADTVHGAELVAEVVRSYLTAEALTDQETVR